MLALVVTHVSKPQITPDDQKQLTEVLGIEELPPEGETLSRVRAAIEPSIDAEFASVGEAIRSDLEGELDAEFLEEALSELEDNIERLPEVREAGIPEGETEPEELYRELIEPAWRVYDHLLAVGFFESVDENQPRFEPEHIEATTHTLLKADPLMSELETLGLDEREQLALVMDVTNNQRRLSRWVPTSDIPDEVEFDVDHVPPLHQRAMGGALLWIKNLDVHLWQKSLLITEEILDDASWDVKAMLVGMHMLTHAAREIADADGGSLTDSQLTSALTASAAILITNQEAICQDAYRITEEMRAPPEYR